MGHDEAVVERIQIFLGAGMKLVMLRLHDVRLRVNPGRSRLLFYCQLRAISGNPAQDVQPCDPLAHLLRLGTSVEIAQALSVNPRKADALNADQISAAIIKRSS